MDRINIKSLEVIAKHGVHPEEKTHSQLFVVSAALCFDLRPAGMSDDLGKTLDYSHVCQEIKKFIVGSSFDLIETIAERLAEKLLMDNPQLKKVWIEVGKPEAKMPVNLETVSVEIERSRHTAYIGLGSNLGDRKAYLRFAIGELRKVSGCKVLQVSKFINTAPYGYANQDDFLNGCLVLSTLQEPFELLETLIEIENKAGRVRDIRWGPRTLDLDIIMYDDLFISTDRLRIPHPEMQKRDFVLRPLSEIAPGLLHPVYKKTVSEMLTELGDKS